VRDPVAILAKTVTCGYIRATHRRVATMTADTIVRARIDAETKQRATAALDAMGLSVSDAIRLLMLRIADEQRLPFAVEVPNVATRRAMKELEAGKGKTYDSTAEMMKDFGL
jgi:DNA-damage-inducible protein J